LQITESQLRQIIREEVDSALDENARKAIATAGLGLSLGASTPSYADYTDTSSQDQTTQQVDKAQDASQLVKNDDGTFSLTIELPDNVKNLPSSMKLPFGRNLVRGAFAQEMAGINGVVNVDVTGKATVSGDTATFTGNIIK
jgi:hypothetical protein